MVMSRHLHVPWRVWSGIRRASNAAGLCMGGVWNEIQRCLENSIDGKVTVLVEGNIASGKTTYLRQLSAVMNDADVLHEPLKKWRNLNGTNLLDMLYRDPRRHAFLFQSYVQLTMTQVHKTPQVSPIRLLERSVFSARYAFVENLRNLSLISDVEYAVLDNWFQWIVKNANLNVDLIVYLKSDPEVCMDRILNRDRQEELRISMTYLQQLHDLHEQWLMEERFPLPAEVIVVDANAPLEQLSKCVGPVEEKMKVFT